MWREEANVDADLDTDFGFAIVADCVVNHIYIEFLVKYSEKPVNCLAKYAPNWQKNLSSVEQRKNADHLFWPPMNLIDNFCSAPVTQHHCQPILHLSGWENI